MNIIVLWNETPCSLVDRCHSSPYWVLVFKYIKDRDVVCSEYFGRHIRASAQGQIMACNLRLEVRGEVGATSLFKHHDVMGLWERRSGV